MDYDLRGRICLVTGASSGIGAGIVRLFSEQGAKVMAIARRVDRIERLEGVTAVAADVTRPGDLDRVAALGQVEVLVNCAGGSRPTTPDSGEEVWDEAFALNFTAVRRLTTALLPAMRERKWGRIVNISGSMEPRGLNAAIAAKGALHLWTPRACRATSPPTA
jgi:3-oxoacyl-[acyl-carrier protein] reductase